MAKRCKYCGSKLDANGYCSKPCVPAQNQKKIEEEQKALEEAKKK
jgi:hypothetical protein